MATAMRMGGASKEDIFAKVKGLIADMIERLEKEADADAKHKAYCDKELAYADKKKADRVAEIEKLTTAIDSMSAKSAQLKEEIATLEKELADIAVSQAKMDQIRAAENEEYLSNKADMEQGIKGVQLALKVLRDYYNKDDKAHGAAEGAGGGIIGLLEVIESDFSSALAEFTSVEETDAATYDKQTKENEIERTTKEQDVKYKNKESTDLDKAVSEASSDRAGVQTELDAVNEYLKSLAGECITTGGNMGTEGYNAESYEQRVARRTAEIAGLKEAFTILQGEASLLQFQHSGRKSSFLSKFRVAH